MLRRETEKAIEAWIPAIVYTMFIFGVSDELYQSTVPGRIVDFFDWVADALGIVVGSVVARVSAALAAAEHSSA